MDDLEFLLALKDYIELAESTSLRRDGDTRSLQTLIEQDDMPDVYREILQRLHDAEVAGEAPPTGLEENFENEFDDIGSDREAGM